MATTDVERLVVSLEASISKYERAMSKAMGVTNSTMQRIERRQATAIQRVEQGWQGLQRGIAAAFASAAALRGAQQLIDASTRIENSLKVAGLAGEDLAEVYDSLFQSAQRNAAPLESLVTLYGRAAIVQKELGVSTEELLGFTDNVATALRVAGTDAQSASGALLQLSQALGSGTVRAEEFNSVLEGALPIAQAAAAGLEEAGGSVAKLRALVVEGRVSSEAFFRAFEAGSVILKEKVAGSELTVSQAFVRLQNVLIDAAGKFDNASGAGQRFANFLGVLGDKITEFANSPGFEKALNDFGDAAAEGFARDARDIQRILELLERVQAGFDRFGESIADTALELGQAEQALATFALNTEGKFGDVGAAAQDLFQQILEGRGTAEKAAEALSALGEADPDFAPLLTKISGVIQRIYELRAAAVAAAAVDVSGTPMSYAGQDAAPRPVALKPVSLTDYAPPSGGGGGGGGGSSRYAEAVAAQEKRIAALQRETQLQATLNPLVNDYGFAVEKLRAQMELENAAKEQGLALDEPRRQQIDELASGYAQATAEAARLAEAQDMARQSAEDLANAGREALDTIIDGFLEGKDAGEIFNNVLKDLGRNLLNMGLNSIFGGGGGLGGLLGGLFGGRGFASGTANTGGQRGQPRGVVHGQEAVIPLPAGGNVPVDIRMPSLPSAQPQALQVHIVSDDEKFGAYVTDTAGKVVAQSAPGIVGASVSQANKTAPSAMAKFQQQRGGSDYRVS